MLTDTLRALRAVVAQNPTDWDARRVLADALEENGDLVGANGQRWQAWKRKRPRRSASANEYAWVATSMRRVSSEHALSSRLLDLMHEEHRATLPSSNGKPQRPAKGWPAFYYRPDPSPDMAEAALARALWSLGIFVRGDE